MVLTDLASPASVWSFLRADDSGNGLGRRVGYRMRSHNTRLGIAHATRAETVPAGVSDIGRFRPQGTAVR